MHCAVYNEPLPATRGVHFFGSLRAESHVSTHSPLTQHRQTLASQGVIAPTVYFLSFFTSHRGTLSSAAPVQLGGRPQAPPPNIRSWHGTVRGRLPRHPPAGARRLGGCCAPPQARGRMCRCHMWGIQDHVHRRGATATRRVRLGGCRGGAACRGGEWQGPDQRWGGRCPSSMGEDVGSANCVGR